MPVTYCDRAYEEVMTWTANTKIKYAPNRKSGKSFHRYNKYMNSKTVGQSLANGSYPLDLLFDFEKGLLWPIGGPKRDRPPDISKESGLTRDEIKQLPQTDRVLGAMYAKWKMWKRNFAVLEEHGLTRQQLKEMNDEQDAEGGRDSILVAIGRREAQQKAKEFLAAADSEKRMIMDSEILECLRLWGFKENSNRSNVMPDGAKFVYSDTIGIIKMSTCERTLLTVGSKRYPEFTKLLTRWLKERLPANMKEFTYTSININKQYAGKLHRDGNNVGPSFIKAFGEFSGGELNYWPRDGGNGPLEDLKQKDKVQLDISDSLLLFDGNRGHLVQPFKGERYSLVFFSVRTWNKVPKKELAEAKKVGIPMPTDKSMKYAKSLLGKTGYRLWKLEKHGQNSDTPKKGIKRKGDITPSPVASKKPKKTSPGAKRKTP